MSLAEGVLQILEDGAAQHGYRRVKTVWLELGRLSHVEPEALRFSLEVVLRGTLAEGARLEFIEVAGQGWCLDCRETVALNALYDACPRCGGHQLQLTAGDAMRVKELEVE